MFNGRDHKQAENKPTLGFLPTFGDMPLWNSLASGGVLPYISEGSRYFYTTPDRGIAASLQDLTQLFTGKPACEAWSKGIAGV